MILGFTGKAGSGKSTVCEYIKTKQEFKRINFKDALLQELKDNFTPLIEEIYDASFRLGVLEENTDIFQAKPPMMRKLMQCYGTEVRRGDDPLYWIKQWKSKVTYTGGNILTDDVRFLNEAEAVHDFGGYVVRVVREDITDTGTHSSESEMDQIVPDFTITAKKGDFEDLHRQIDEILNSIENVQNQTQKV